MVESSRPFVEMQSFTGGHGNQGQGHEFELNDINDPVPEGLPEPATYRMFVMPVGLKRSLTVKSKETGQEVGKIFMPDESVDAEIWLNCLGKVAKLGPACFKHGKYAELGLGPDDFPKVGDLILYSSRAPMRFQFRGVRILVLNDDHWFAKGIDPAVAGHFKFYV